MKERESEVSLEDSPSYPDLSELSFARPDPHPPLMSHRRAGAGGRRKTRHKATRIHVLHFHCGVLFLSSPPPNKGQDRERDRERAGERHHSIIRAVPFSTPNLPYSLPPSFSLCVALFRAILRCICAAWRLTLEGTKKVRKKDPRFAIIASH